jgi:hypothetical protein
MDAGVWSAFLDWLSASGLLTAKAQSRDAGAAAAASGGNFASLEGMRSGGAGDPIPRGSVRAADLATNDFLPAALAAG